MFVLLIAATLLWQNSSKKPPEKFPFKDLFVEKLDDGGYEIQVGVDGALTEEKKAAMLEEIKRITGEEDSGMIFTLDKVKPTCDPNKHKDKNNCKSKSKSKSDHIVNK